MLAYNRMDDDKVTTIISADYMYLIFLGDDEIMSELVDKLNSFEDQIENEKVSSYKSNKSNRNRSRQIYISSEIDTPCINMLDDSIIQKILTDDAIKNIKKNREKTRNNNKEISQDDIDVNKKYVVIDEGVETAQCLTYADMSYSGTKNRSSVNEEPNKIMMLMVMVSNDSHYKLSYPILQLDEEENPAELIDRWLKEHDLKTLIKELTISPVNIVGNEHDILVFSAIVN